MIQTLCCCFLRVVNCIPAANAICDPAMDGSPPSLHRLGMDPGDLARRFSARFGDRRESRSGYAMTVPRYSRTLQCALSRPFLNPNWECWRSAGRVRVQLTKAIDASRTSSGNTRCLRFYDSTDSCIVPRFGGKIESETQAPRLRPPRDSARMTALYYACRELRGRTLL
jgi:hypothetical protein